MALVPITKEELLASNIYYKDRWGYTSRALEFVAKRNPQTLLELGPGYVPLFAGSDTMTVWNGPTFNHDLMHIPWPVEDKAYDMIVALQVWEHLNGAQAAAFREVQRVGRAAVLSFPLMWDSCPPNDDHYQISEEQIMDWVDRCAPSDRAVVRNCEDRLVLAFDFRDGA